MGNSVIWWSRSAYAEWAGGERRMTGPGLIEFNEQGQVVGMLSLLPPEPESEKIQVHVATVEVPKVPKEPPPEFYAEFLT